MVRGRVIGRRLRACVLILTAAGAWPVPALRPQDTVVPFEAVDDYIGSKMAFPRIPGLAVAIVKEDRTVLLKGYGRADSSGRPVTPQTPFLIGSVTKPFTALAVLQLAEAGKVDLDAPVRKYLPWFSVADAGASARITVRHLMTMTSGIPQGPTLVSWLWPDEEGAMERHVRLLANVRPRDAPGRSTIYANANYVTLGVLIEKVSGLTYEDYLRRNIFDPLDMRHSCVSQDAARRDGLATGYRWWFGFPVAADLPFSRSNLAAGFVISCAEDMGNFLIAQMNGGRFRDRSLLSPEGIARMHEVPSPEAYGLGWEAVRLHGRTVIDHDGGTGNFQASVFFDPERRIGVFIVANAASGLDAFSSPHGASLLDGATVRAMAESVFCMVAGEPLPDQGWGKRWLTIIFDAVILVLTLLLVASVARLPGRWRKLARQGITRGPELAWRGLRIAALHFIWPVLVLYLWLGVLFFRVNVVMFQPDLAYWLAIAAGIVFFKGILELIHLGRVHRIGRAPAAPR